MNPEPEVIIRHRRDDDLDELARILVQVHAQDGYPVEGVADPHAWLHLERPLGAWVAEVNGEVVGHVALTEPGPHDDAPRMWAEQTDEPIEEVTVLGRLFVCPRARMGGVARALVDRAIRAATVLRRPIVLDVMRKDHAAIRLYERTGFTNFGSFIHIHSDGQSEPGLAYARQSS